MRVARLASLGGWFVWDFWRKRNAFINKGKRNFLIFMNPELKIVISGSFRKYLHYIGIALANFQKANIKILAPLTQEVVSGRDDFVFLVTDDPEKSADVLEK